jgi:hypothetical protein
VQSGGRAGGSMSTLNHLRHPGVCTMAAADHIGDQPGPAGLVRRTQASTIIAVEVLVEEQIVAPPRIGLHPLRVAEARPSSVLVDEEDRHQALPEIRGDDI